ncbi:hypothetical protein SDC9_134399 [bioreactor metagenome]|uniref:Uncharacterized protein n=1 Tax=bioreactor metagenome TaxID=1076179 RepID=A0A645DEM9_9ZZZZ
MFHIDLRPAIDRILHQNIDIVFYVVERINATAEQMVGYAEDVTLPALHLYKIFNRKPRVGHICVRVQVV